MHIQLIFMLYSLSKKKQLRVVIPVPTIKVIIIDLSLILYRLCILKIQEIWKGRLFCSVSVASQTFLPFLIGDRVSSLDIDIEIVNIK
jgi:hypothetical protein